MSKDLEQQLKPDLPFLRKWVKIFKKTHGESSLTNELEKLVKYAHYMKDRVEQLELYNECFKKIIEEDQCQQNNN
jgi:hypothetical protein